MVESDRVQGTGGGIAAGDLGGGGGMRGGLTVSQLYQIPNPIGHSLALV